MLTFLNLKEMKIPVRYVCERYFFFVQVESTLDLEETLQLERGQNLFEIHIQKVCSPFPLYLVER